VLVAFFVLTLAIRLPGETDQRSAIHVGVGHTGDQVRCPRAQRSETYTRLPSESPVNFRHEGGALLVTRQDEFDRRIFERHHEVGILFAGHTENLRHTFGLQAFHEQIGCLHASPPESVDRIMAQIGRDRDGWSLPASLTVTRAFV